MMDSLVKQLEDAGLEESSQNYNNDIDDSTGALVSAKQQIAEKTKNIALPSEAADVLQGVFAYAIRNKEQYSQIRKELVEEGIFSDATLPKKYDQKFLSTLLVIFNELSQNTNAFAKGGSVSTKSYAQHLADQGRNGDTLLAHITPEEALLLKQLGGSGTINPKTGLPEFFLKKLFKGVKKAVKSVGDAVGDVVKSVGDAVGDVAREIVSTPIGQAVATVGLTVALGPAGAGLSTALAGAAAGAVVGGVKAEASGGSFIDGAIKGGIVGGVGGALQPVSQAVGSTVSSALGNEAVGQIAGNAVSGAVRGGIGSLISGQDPLTGALTGGLTSGVTAGVGSLVGKADLPVPLERAASAAIASEILGGDTERSVTNALIGSLPGYVAEKVSAPDAGEEGFFDIGGEGYSPYEEQYGFVADPYAPPSSYFETPGVGDFLGENVPSGVPEWDYAAVEAGLPIGNLEQDFVVDQNGNIIDNAGNRGEFVNGEWVVRSDPKDFLNYVAPPAPAPKAAPAPAAPKPPSPAPAPAAQKGLDLGALMAMLGGMHGAQEEVAPEYAPARVTNVSPFGLPYGMRG